MVISLRLSASASRLFVAPEPAGDATGLPVPAPDPEAGAAAAGGAGAAGGNGGSAVAQVNTGGISYGGNFVFAGVQTTTADTGIANIGQAATSLAANSSITFGSAGAP